MGPGLQACPEMAAPFFFFIEISFDLIYSVIKGLNNFVYASGGRKYMYTGCPCIFPRRRRVIYKVKTLY
jgi:hypothetical protein